MSVSRYYKKGNPDIEPLESIGARKKVTTSGDSFSMIAPSPKYTKPEASKLPQALFVIYSGGERREKDYFRIIDRNTNLFPFIRIAFHPEPNFDKGGKPTIIQFAKEKTKEYKESASEENTDSYFLLSDVDHFGRFLSEMKQDCEANDIELIISNPCFEVWLYYAERNDHCANFQIPQNILEISSSFKTWANSELKGGLKPKKAIFFIEQNIANAKNNYVEENKLPTLFSTQMFRLAEQMLPYIKDGLETVKVKINNH